MNTKLLSRSVIAASTLALTLFSALYAAPASAYGRGAAITMGMDTVILVLASALVWALA